jgi:hypothetical protein
LSLVASGSAPDPTLEIWGPDGLIAQNDDGAAWLNPALTVTVRGGTTYAIGYGDCYDTNGTSSITQVLTPTAPTVPLNVQATTADASAVVTWDAPSDPSGDVTYTVSYRESLSPTAPWLTLPAGADRAATVGGLTNGTQYEFRIVATNSVGLSSPMSEPALATPMSPPTIAISILPSPPTSGHPYQIVVAVSGTGGPAVDGWVTVTVAGSAQVPALTGPDGRITLWATARPVGAYEVSAAFAGSLAVLPGSATTSVVVAQNPQTVTIDAISASLAYGDTAALIATASSGLTPVAFASDTPAVCTVSGAVLTMVGVGPCTATASQAGDSETEAASASQTVDVGRRAQTLSMEPLEDMVYGQPAQDVDAASNRGLPVTVTASGSCAMDGGNLVTTAAGLCTVTVTQDGDALNLPAEIVTTLDVAKRPQTVTLSALPLVITGVQQLPVTATSEFGLPVTITASGACAFASGQVWVTGVGTCTVTAASPGDAVTLPATATATASVASATARVSAWVSGGIGDLTAAGRGGGRGSQLLPGSSVTVTAYSDPQRVATATVRADGTVSLTGQLPALDEGTHRVVVAGVALDGTAVTHTTRLGVAADGTITWLGTAPNLAATGTDAITAGMLALLWVMVGAGLLLARRGLARRRRPLLA